MSQKSQGSFYTNNMNYSLLKEVIRLAEQFEKEQLINPGTYSGDGKGFKKWIVRNSKKFQADEPDWEGKGNGRSAESVINTLIVHMNRYAKLYSKSAIWDSEFSTQEEFIYLINLRSFGAMTKMELIKKNIQEKPAGMQIINRLIKQGWVNQTDSQTDKRSKIIEITDAGYQALELRMSKIRQATKIVTGDLSYPEKMELIRLLTKLDEFHNPIFNSNVSNADLLDTVITKYLPSLN